MHKEMDQFLKRPKDTQIKFKNWHYSFFLSMETKALRSVSSKSTRNTYGDMNTYSISTTYPLGVVLVFTRVFIMNIVHNES